MTIKIYSDAISTEVAPAVTKYVSEFGVMCEYNYVTDLEPSVKLILQLINLTDRNVLFDFHDCSKCFYLDGTIVAELPSQRSINKDLGETLGVSSLAASYENRTFEFDIRIERDFSDEVSEMLSELAKISELAQAYYEKNAGDPVGFKIRLPGSSESLLFNVIAVSFSLSENFMSADNLMVRQGTTMDSIHISIETLPLGFTQWTSLVEQSSVESWTYGQRNSTILINSTAIEGDAQAPLRITLHNDGNKLNGFAINRYAGRQFGILTQSLLQPFIPLAGTNIYSQLGGEWEYEEKRDNTEVDKNKTASGFFARFNVIGLNQVPAAREWHTLAVTSHTIRPEMNGTYMVILRCRHSPPAIGGTPNIFDLRLYAVYDGGTGQVRRLLVPHKTLISRYNNWAYMKCGLVRVPLNFRLTRSHTNVTYYLDVRIVNYNSVEPPLVSISQEKLDIDFLIFERQDAMFFAQSASLWDDSMSYAVVDSSKRITGIKQTRTGTITNSFLGGTGGVFPTIVPGVDNLLNFRLDSDANTPDLEGYELRTANANSLATVDIEYMPQYLHVRGLR